jgi:hypothetical protein
MTGVCVKLFDLQYAYGFDQLRLFLAFIVMIETDSTKIISETTRIMM